MTGGVFGLQQFAGAFYAANPVPVGSYGLGQLTFSARDLWVMLVGGGAVAVPRWACSCSFAARGDASCGRSGGRGGARSLGKNVYGYKIQSLVLGRDARRARRDAARGRRPGGGAQHVHPVVTFYLYTLLILGGAGTVLGPVLGSVPFWFLLSFADGALRQAIRAAWYCRS